MKNRIITLVAVVAMLAAGCDKIKSDEYVIYAGSTAEWTAGTPIANPVQRAYVEKYTGPKCTNCPLADATLDAVHETYNHQMVIVAINHPTGQGEPFAGQPDMRTEDGSAWDAYFGINSIPAAFVNRNTDKPFLGAMNTIGDEVGTVVATSPVVAIEGESLFSGADVNQAEITVNLQFVQAYTSPLTLTLALIEDSLVYWQLLPSGTKQDDYVHNHMLRDVITDLWGTDIDCTGAAGEARTATFRYAAKQNLSHCHVVAFISDKASRKVLNCVQLDTKIQ